jgi:hypothetical protein
VQLKYRVIKRWGNVGSCKLLRAVATKKTSIRGKCNFLEFYHSIRTSVTSLRFDHKPKTIKITKLIMDS